MARTATATVKAADPAAERRAVLDRILARTRPPKVTFRMDPQTGEKMQDVARVAGDSERVPPRDLGEWADDRVAACFGGRLRLNPAEQAAYGILQAMRSGDAAAVAEAVRTAGGGLDVLQQHAVWPLLDEWRSRAPAFALGVTSAAAAEARLQGWDVRPHRRALEKIQKAAAAALTNVGPDLYGPDGTAVAPATEKLLGRPGRGR